MKTIKLIGITLLLLFPSLTVLAQSNEGPTQEETIAWITEKLERYGGYNYEKVEVTPCAITEYLKWNETDSKIYTNPTTATLTYKIEEGKIKFSYAYDVVRFQTPDGIKMISESISVTNSEEGLGERMLKAIKHLATFCEADKKEESF